jgi:Pyruvate/2-oxoacid:ferredoxin oxidoreductase delta subunit
MKMTRKIIEIDEELCDGCGQCVPSCAEGAIQIIDGKARLVEDKYCDGLGACMGECPTGALSIVERESEEFDEEAVQEHLSSIAEKEPPKEASLPCGCPSVQLKAFGAPAPGREADEPAAERSSISALCHWPVKIKLMPPAAPFLKGADLLVAADCTPFAYANFHEDFLKGRVVLVGCPKFDDVREYLHRFVEIFKTADIKSVTIPIMEVPCCSGLPMIVKKAMKEAKKEIPLELVVISARGEVMKKEQLAA